jgi:hypothetical protein
MKQTETDRRGEQKRQQRRTDKKEFLTALSVGFDDGKGTFL